MARFISASPAHAGSSSWMLNMIGWEPKNCPCVSFFAPDVLNPTWSFPPRRERRTETVGLRLKWLPCLKKTFAREALKALNAEPCAMLTSPMRSPAAPQRQRAAFTLASNQGSRWILLINWEGDSFESSRPMRRLKRTREIPSFL